MKEIIMQVEKINISLVKPYWRNPRENKDGVEKVKRSIQEYGYRNPILVDKNNVIIAGHTRYKALLQLGYKEIEIIVAKDMDENKAKEYRIIDNKTSEYSKWSETLEAELRGFTNDDILKEFFPNVDFGLSDVRENIASDNINIGNIENSLKNKFLDRSNVMHDEKVNFICPNCGEEFSMNKSDIDREEGEK